MFDKLNPFYPRSKLLNIPTVRRDSFDPITDESEENSEQCLLICCDEANT